MTAGRVTSFGTSSPQQADCGAAIHNATTWRAKTCRCDVGRDDHNRQQRIVRKERELGRPRRLPAAATQRQIRDLMAAGWPVYEIAPRIGWASGNMNVLLTQRWVQRRTAERVAAVYEQLRSVAGPSDLTRRRAARADWWLPPVEQCGAVDPVSVQRAVDGDPPDTLTKQERREAVRVLYERGYTYSEIAQRLRTHSRMVHRDLTALGLIGAVPVGTAEKTG